jgi:hypothetical protein
MCAICWLIVTAPRRESSTGATYASPTRRLTCRSPTSGSPGARADLLSAYGRPVGARRELAARAAAVSLAASLAEYAADDGRPELLRECVAGLKRAVAA